MWQTCNGKFVRLKLVGKYRFKWHLDIFSASLTLWFIYLITAGVSKVGVSSQGSSLPQQAKFNPGSQQAEEVRSIFSQTLCKQKTSPWPTRSASPLCLVTCSLPRLCFSLMSKWFPPSTPLNLEQVTFLSLSYLLRPNLTIFKMENSPLATLPLESTPHPLLPCFFVVISF